MGGRHRSRRSGRRALPALAGALLAGALGAAPAHAAPDDDGPAASVQRVISDPRITESSGLARSRVHRGVLWTHNDSGAGPLLYAVGWGGHTRATYEVSGVRARDWEALAPGYDEQGRPALYVGDVGDNERERDEILVHRVTEPDELDGGALAPTSFRLRYPDGPHDAEALLVHPETGRLHVVTKSGSGGVYAAPSTLDEEGVNALVRVADAPSTVTDGTFLDDGRLVLRTYQAAYVSAGVGEPARRLELPDQRQGESLAAAWRDDRIYVGSEGRESAVWRLKLTRDDD